MNEIYVLLGMVLCGAVVSVVFDFRRGVQRAVKLPDAAVIIADVLFWIFAAVAAAWSIWVLNGGIIRIYVIVGFISGSVLYFMLLSRWAVKLFAAAAKNILKIFAFIFKILLTPLCFLYKIIIAICSKFNMRKKEFKINEHNAGKNP